ncbi:MAG: S41 family peptidase [Bacteroidales bacterium]|nr:S41 family peptidase [Bacteroidales bacterium]
MKRIILTIALICAGITMSDASVPSDRSNDSNINNSQQIENISAFAKVYGVARWFVPSDEAADTDWNKLAVEGVSRVSDCRDSDELADSLESVFDDMIPMLSVDEVPESEAINKYYAAVHSGRKPIRWQHLGVDLGPESHDYISRRTNRPYDTKNTSKFAFTGYVRSEESDTDTVRLEVVSRAYDSPESIKGCFHFCTWTNTEEYITPLYRVEPLTEELGQEWEKVTMTLELPDKKSSRYINWGIFPDGDGKMTVQSVRIYTGSGKDIYSLDCTKGYDYVGNHCWLGYRTYHYLESEDGLTAICRKEVYKDTESRNLINLPVADGLYAHIPLLLYDGYDKPAGKKEENQNREYSEEERNIADIIVMWNVIRYFSPYLNESGMDWDLELKKAVRSVLEGEDGIRVLKRMLGGLQDAHIYYPNESIDLRQNVLPAVIAYIEDKAVVLESMDPQLKPGDILVTADKKNVAKYAQEEMTLFSASDHTSSSWLYQSPMPCNSSEVRCVIKRSGKRLTLNVPSIPKGYYFQLYWQNYYSNGDSSRWIDDNICYINLSNTSFTAIGNLLEKRTDDDFVIIDMRKRTSGFIAREILQYIAPDLAYRNIPDYIPKSSYPEVKNPSYRAEYVSPMCKTPDEYIIFLSGPRNISNEEIFLDFVKHRGVGIIIGENSAGISGAINTATLPSGLKVSFSGQRAYSNSGMEEDYYINGVTPHIVVNTSIDDLAAGKDAQFEAAMKFINEQR